MPLDIGRVTHLLDQMHRSEDDAGDPIDAGFLLAADGARGQEWVDPATLGGGGSSFIDATDYGAELDVRGVNDAATSGAVTTVTSATAAFTSADTGRTFVLTSTAGAVTTGTLTFVNSTTATMSVAAGAAMSGARLIIGTDDTTAWQDALDAALPGQVIDAAGSWRSLVAGNLTVPVGVTLGLGNRGPFDPQTNPALNAWGPTFVMVQNATAFVTLNHESGVGDIIFYSANQKPPSEAIPTTTYAAVITMDDAGTAGCHIGSPYMPNCYIGMDIQGGRHVIGSPQFGALLIGIRIDHSQDTVSIQRIHCSPYWRICEGQAYTPTASSFDAYALNNAYGLWIARSDAFAVDQIFTFGLYGAIFATDSTDGALSPKCGYGMVGMVDADIVAVGITAQATNTPGIIVGTAMIGANSTGVGTAGQAALATITSGSLAPTLLVGALTHRGSWAVSALSNAAGTLIAPNTNPGISAGEFGTQTAVVATGETTTSTTAADLATAGPSVTVNIGASGKAKVSLRCRMQNGTAGEFCVAYVTISGATTVAPTALLITVSGAIGSIYEVGATKIFSGLNAGSTTFKMQYSVQVAHGTNTFTSREIIVEPVL
jgi:hypothetical protein